MKTDLFQSIIQLKTSSQCSDFFSQICTEAELTRLASRFRQMQRQTNVRIAVQSKGRLSDPSLEFLFSAGLSFNPNGRNCLVTCENYDIDLLFLRDDDIPRYVARGVADFGIVGKNIVLEQNVKVTVAKELEFGICSLVIAVPNESPIRTVQDLQGKRIATTYPTTLRNYLKQKRIKASIIQLKGSVEIAPTLDLADAICDLTQSGKTLTENNLKPLETVLESKAVLIQTPKSTKRNLSDVCRLLNITQ